MNKTSVSCLIPFFNESRRLSEVLKQLKQIPAITQFVLVDDGSTEPLPEILLPSNRFRLLSLTQNLGKSQAVSVGIRSCTNSSILLFDADITQLDVSAINNAIALFSARPTLDHVIFERYNPSLLTRLNRIDTVFAGERLLKKTDLEQVLTCKQLTHYQLETAINHYMITHHKYSYFVPTSHQNPSKRRKRGSFRGHLQNIAMFWNVFTYQPLSYFYQLVFFCRTNLLLHQS